MTHCKKCNTGAHVFRLATLRPFELKQLTEEGLNKVYVCWSCGAGFTYGDDIVESRRSTK